jgi:hypothetical protein
MHACVRYGTWTRVDSLTLPLLCGALVLSACCANPFPSAGQRHRDQRMAIGAAQGTHCKFSGPR